MTQPMVVKLNSPNGIVNAVPYLLGFQPNDSIVCIAIKGERGRLSFTARFDYPHDSAIAQLVTADIARRMKQAEADTAMVVIYSELSSEGLAANVQDALDAEGIRCRDLIRVDNGRWWSFLCDNPECCPTQGTLIVTDDQQTTSLAAAHVLSRGRRPLASREDVIATVAPRDVLTPEAFSNIEPVDCDEVQRMLLPTTDGAQLTDRDIATVLRSLTSVPTRDALIMALSQDNSRDESLPTLIEITRRAPDALLAPAASVSAIVAYMAGDGLLANALATRALEQGEYSLASLVMATIQAQIDPAQIREMVQKGL